MRCKRVEYEVRFKRDQISQLRGNMDLSDIIQASNLHIRF